MEYVNMGRDDDFEDNLAFIFETLTESTNDYIYMRDLANDLFFISPKFVTDFSLPQKSFSSFQKSWSNRILKQDVDRYNKALDDVLAGKLEYNNMEYRIRLDTGKYIWMKSCCRLKKNPFTGDPSIFMGIIQNLENRGEVDFNTGLFTHKECINHLSRLTELNESSKESEGGILLLNIDDLTNINNKYSHSFGNLLLYNFAQRIKSLLPTSASLYYFEGDQYSIIYENADQEVIKQLYHQISACAIETLEDGNLYPYSISAGAAIHTHHIVGNWCDLFECAQIALKSAKETGKSKCVLYTDDMKEGIASKDQLIQCLQKSVQKNCQGFSLVYQPVNDASTLSIKGAEALLRYQDTTLGFMSPADFIPVLESTHLICPVGMWVLEQAISICKKWILYIPNFIMNINVSYLQLQESDFCAKLEALLQKYQLLSRHILLELTESYFFENDKKINNALRSLRSMGIALGMDDFGTGYSSLSRLAQFQVDLVKIDQLFVRSLNNRLDNRDFVESVIRYCHNNGLLVCVEGVENREEFTLVNSLYADSIQGYYVAKPMSEELFFNTFIIKNFDVTRLLVKQDKAASIKRAISDKELLKLMTDATPLCLNLWNQDFENISCNKESVILFDLKDENEYLERFFELSPPFQPDGQPSKKKAYDKFKLALTTGKTVFSWMHCKLNGEEIPAEITLVRIAYLDGYIVAGYTRDIRPQLAVTAAEQQYQLRIQLLFDAMPLCVNLWNRDFQNIQCNKHAVTLFHLEKEQDYLDHFFELSPPFQPTGQPSDILALEKITEAFDNGACKFQWMHCDLQGNPIPAEITLLKIQYEQEEVVAGFTRDIREQLAMADVEKTSTDRMKTLLNAMPLSCLLWNKENELIECNHEAVAMFHVANEEEVLKHYREFTPLYQPDGRLSSDKLQEKARYAFKNGRCTFDWNYLDIYGNPIPCEMTLVHINYQEADTVAAYCRDLRELIYTKELNSELKQLAYNDFLTDSSTRFYFTETLENKFKNLKPEDLFALIMIDIDHFKGINDTYGHYSGDLALKKIISCIRSIFPAETIIGRYGGDEFAILLENLNQLEIESLLKKTCVMVSQMSIYSDNFVFQTTISVGAALWTPTCDNSQHLLDLADHALYKTKKNGRNGFSISVYQNIIND